MDNYPDCLGEANAPWNRPDACEGQVCGTCRNLVEVELTGGIEIVGCFSDGKVWQVQKDDRACDGWVA